jgi:hypothetical protein
MNHAWLHRSIFEGHDEVCLEARGIVLDLDLLRCCGEKIDYVPVQDLMMEVQVWDFLWFIS